MSTASQSKLWPRWIYTQTHKICVQIERLRMRIAYIHSTAQYSASHTKQSYQAQQHTWMHSEIWSLDCVTIRNNITVFIKK